MALRIYSYPNNPRVWKALIAAKYVGVEIETPEFKIGVDNKTPEFSAKNPAQKVPVLETPEGCIFESNAIARYVARQPGSKIYGNSRFQDALIDQWTDFAINEIELPSAAWLFPIMEIVPPNEEATIKAKGDIRKALGILNQHLATRTFLVGERISFADIVVSMVLYRLYKMVMDLGFRKAFANLNRWYLTCVNQPQFKAVIGEVELCEKMMTAKEAPETEKTQQPPKKKPEKKQPKKEEKPHEHKEEKPHEEHHEGKKEKAQHPLDLLPPSKFVLDEWKRMYSNNDVRSVAMPWFWDHLDPAGWSVWFCDYKYNHECEKLFKTNNLVGGWFQRLDKVRRFGFGSVLIFGDEPKLSISGMWLFRGQEVPEEMRDTPDFELYTFTKVDSADAATRVKVDNYWAWDFPESDVIFRDQGKVFK